MSPSIVSQPWFFVFFGIVWVAAMAYVSTFLFTVVRIRRLTGEAQGSGDWLRVFQDPLTIRYLGWVFSSRHKTLGDPLVSRLVLVVRTLFVLTLPAILLLFALVFLSSRAV